MGIPGYDHITPNMADGKQVKSLNLGGRLVASAAAQNGEPLVQSECFACNPYNFGYDGMKKIAHWLYALGVNWLVPHGFHYSYDGYRKDDAGKSFFFQNGDYSEFHRFADYMARLGYKLGSGKSAASVCILYPVSVFRGLIPAERKLAEALRERLYDCVQFMFDRHIQFEIADNDTLISAKIENRRVICGECSYATIVAPFSELDSRSADWLDAIKASGVEVLRFPEETFSLEKRNGFSLRTSAGNGTFDSLMTLRKLRENEEILYIYSNQSSGGFYDLELNNAPAHGVYLYDVGKDCHFRLKPMDGNKFRFTLSGYGAALLVFPDHHDIDAENYLLPERPAEDFSAPYETDPQWDYIPPLPGLLASLRDWEISVNDKSYGSKRYCLIRDLSGTNLEYLSSRLPRPHFDIAPVPKIYPVKAIFKAEFELDPVNPGDQFILLAENDTFAGNCVINLNGTDIPLGSFKRSRRYDPWNIESNVTQACKAGTNQLCLTWKKRRGVQRPPRLDIYRQNINSKPLVAR